MAQSKLLWFAGSCFAMSLAALQGCSSEPEPAPTPPPVGGSTSTGGKGGSSGAGGAAAGAGGSQAGASGSGGAAAGTGGGGSGGGGTGGAAGGTGGASGGGGTAGGGGSGGGGDAAKMALCTDYCTAYFPKCDGHVDDTYTSADDCNTKCNASTWIAGTEEDTSGNTVGCRLWHAEMAADNQDDHCGHAAEVSSGPCADI